MTLALRYAVRSDVGLLREGNEDSAYASPRLLAVADGMGGHAAGEVASAVAIASVAKLDVSMPAESLLDAFHAAVQSASETLHEMACADPSQEGMGTTLTAMLWSGEGYALCHIGDSRGYMLRDGELYQITHDHSLVQSLVDEGRISPEEAATHPQRSLILRALDGRGEAEPDLSMRDAVRGDRYLLCSDGLSDVVSADTLHETLTTVADLEDATVQLVELAIRGGGPDNITVIVADVVDSESAPPPTTAPVLVGAASTAGGKIMDGGAHADSPAARAQMMARTAPQPAVMLDEAGGPPDTAWPDEPAWPLAEEWESDGHSATEEEAGEAGWAATGAGPAAVGGHGTSREERARRRWPIVSTALVVLAAVVVGGGYAAWSYAQHQYYLGQTGGQVAIFRGVNQRVAGFSLSSVYEKTGVPLQAVPSQERQMIAGTVSTASLGDAQRIVSQLQAEIQQCKKAYSAQFAWEKQRNQQQASKSTAHSKKANPLPPEPAIPSMCPPASVIGVQAPSASPSPRSTR